MKQAFREHVVTGAALTARGRKLFPGRKGVKSLSGAFFLLATSFFATSCLRVPRAVLELPSGDWVTRQGNSAHAGFANEQVPVEVHIAWEEGIGRGLQATPIINDGLMIAVISGGGLLTASTADGDPFWSRRFNGGIAGQALRVGSRLFFATQHREGSAYALDVRRGRRLWERDLDARAATEPAYADGVLYVPTDRGEIYALDAANGNVIWQTRLNVVIRQPPIVHGAHLLVIGGDTVVKLERERGSVVDRHTIAGIVSAPAALRGDTLVVVTHTGTVAAYAELGARQLWRYELGSPILAAPAFAAQGVMVLTRDADVFRLDASGSHRVADLPGTATESFSITSDGMLVGLLEGALVYVRNDGAVVWTQKLKGSVRAPAAIFGGSIYVGTLSGKIVKLSP